MPNYSLFDVGGCNCGCIALPCDLAKQNLNINISGTASGSVLYNSGGTACEWNSSGYGGTGLCILLSSGQYFSFFISAVSATCTYFEAFYYTTIANCQGRIASTSYLYENPTGCAGGSNSMTLTSHTCSPLNIVFTSARDTYTLTL